MLSPAQGSITKNLGQVPNPDIRYYASFGGLQVGFARSSVLFTLRETQGTKGVSVRITFGDARPVLPEGREMLPYRANYLVGDDRSRWRASVPTFQQVVYGGLYRNVDLVYRAEPDGLKYEFVVRPGGDLTEIRVSYAGIEALTLEADGGLRARTPTGNLLDAAPVAYQGTTRTPCSFALLGAFSYGFRCGGLDPSQTLVIDPLVYATFLGGTGYDTGFSVAADSAGNAYVTGRTLSVDFPVTPGAFSTASRGADAFVAKLNPGGTALVYATFLGGSGNDTGSSIAVDAAGNAYVTGRTSSADFPATAGAFNTIYNGGTDAFVVKLDSSGSVLRYSTYLGGTRYDSGASIAIDPAGDAFVTGRTLSADFPAGPGAYDTTFNGTRDAFVVEVNPTGSSLVYATFLGGTGSDVGAAIAVDTAGSAYMTGRTDSADFPVTAGAYDTTYNGGTDAFVVKLNAAGSGLAYATFLGGSAYDPGDAIAVDAVGNAYVVSRTNSTNFPVTAGAYDTTYNGGTDAFVVKLNAAASGLTYATFLGGRAYDSADSVAVDAAGNAYVTGHTNSTDFPTTLGALDSTYGGVNDTFVVKVNPGGTALAYATYLGGSNSDSGESLALDSAGNVYVTGRTLSANFPTTLGALESTYNGGSDAFVAKINLAVYQVTVDTSPSGLQVQVGGIMHTAPYTFACGGDSPVALTAPAPQSTVNTRYTFQSWSDGGTQSHAITCVQSTTHTATFTPTDFLVTVETTPTGLQVQVDGAPYAAPQTFWCAAGSSHALNAPSPQVVGTSRYAFASWTDAGAPAHTIVCNAPLTYTASFTLTDYLITLNTLPPGLQIQMDAAPVTTPSLFWCPVGTSHALGVPSPQGSGPTRYAFASWSDGGAMSHTIACDAAGSYTATFVAQYLVAIDTSPPQLVVQADGGWYVAPASFWWNASSRHRIAANSTQVGLNFAYWSDGGGIAHTVTVTGPATITANYTASPVPLTAAAEASVTTGVVPLGVQFTGVAWGGQPPYLWWWTFGDGTGSALRDPTHIFAKPGTYLVTLQVNDTGAPPNSTTTQVQIVALAPPLTLTVDANATAGDAPLRVHFTASASGGIPPYAWWWTFGDGTGSHAQNPSHVFLQAGTYTVTLEVNDADSPQRSASRQLQIVVTMASLVLTGCTVSPDAVDLVVGNAQRFTAIGWSGARTLPGATAVWSAVGGVGSIDASGVFIATGAGEGTVYADVTYNGTAARCRAQVTTVAVPPTPGLDALQGPLLGAVVVAVAVALVLLLLLARRKRRNRKEAQGGSKPAPRPTVPSAPPKRAPPSP